ncbi:hypothetical protein MJM77_17700, partial [Salmonella enterica subsp. enterica serovar Cerro]|nr:hypothetical protein [Salmonella enterica subsp. enterica serovar Cerro]
MTAINYLAWGLRVDSPDDKTMHIDGLKTGHTSGAGFNLIASAVDGQRRLIAVVMGAKSS